MTREEAIYQLEDLKKRGNVPFWVREGRLRE